MNATLRSAARAAAGMALALTLGSSAFAGCVTKAGSATGITKEFAEYESELIIRQVTGNWPIQADNISKPKYTCKSDGALWTCRAVARVCKG